MIGRTRIAVLASGRGRGTNFAALLEGCGNGQMPAEIVLLVSGAPDAPVSLRAEQAGIPVICLPAPATGPGTIADAATRSAETDRFLARCLADHRVNLVCLAGFMRKLGPEVLARYENRIMNVHPSLLPAFGGQGMYGIHVHRAVLEYGARVSGCTVQFINEEYDAGPIILQRVVPVLQNDSPESLAARVLVEEHAGYVEAVTLFAEERLQVEGRRVRIRDLESLSPQGTRMSAGGKTGTSIRGKTIENH